jgi:hypothetical protein
VHSLCDPQRDSTSSLCPYVISKQSFCMSHLVVNLDIQHQILLSPRRLSCSSRGPNEVVIATSRVSLPDARTNFSHDHIILLS